jgi:sigma-B regulation protein RsbU (phosphoserine phosphatase)
VSGKPLLKLEVPARPESLKPLRDAVCAALERAGADEELRQRLKLVIDEAAANVIRHAYGGSGDGPIRLTLERRRGAVRFKLRDFAPPVDPGRIRPRDLSECRPGGLGINFIDDTMDSWCIRPVRGGGNVLIMLKRLRGAPAPATDDASTN